MADQLNIRVGEELSMVFETFVNELGAKSKRDAFERILELARLQFTESNGEDDADARAIKSLLARIQSAFIAQASRRREAERGIEEYQQAWQSEKGELLNGLEAEKAAANAEQIALTNKVATLVKENEEAFAARDEARRVAKLTTREIQRLETQIKDLEKQVKDYPELVIKLESKIKDQTALLEVQGRDLEKATLDLQHSTNAAATAQEKAALDKERAVLDAERAAQEKLEEVRQADLEEVRQLLHKKSELEKQVATVQHEHFTLIEALRQEIEELKRKTHNNSKNS